MSKVLVSLAVLIIAGPDVSEAPDDALKATIQTNAQIMRITNGDAASWADCTVSVNPGIFSGGWSQGFRFLAPQTSVVLAMRDFTDRRGTRFSTATHRLERVMLRCEMNGEVQFYSGTVG